MLASVCQADTTRSGLLTAPLRARFGINARLGYYDSMLLKRIVERSADIMNVPIDEDAAFEIARRSRGTPRIANALLRRVRDFAQIKGDGLIAEEIVKQALDFMKVDAQGLDMMDHKLLSALTDKFDGHPVGLESLAAFINEEKGTIEEVIEPFLIQQGFILRTSRGRLATKRAYLHLGLSVPSKFAASTNLNLFEDVKEKKEKSL